MNDIYLYDIVKLKRSYLYGIDFWSRSKEDYLKDSEGVVLEILGDSALIEFDNNQYECPVTEIKLKDLVFIKHQN